MRNTIYSTLLAVVFFVFGLMIINLQLWYSAKTIIAAGARESVENINTILDEAKTAAKTAIDVSEKGCTPEGQYRLGTEAALKPHLRTILIVKNDQMWCSSLPGNRKLIARPEHMPKATLTLIPARETANQLPVLIYQTQTPDSNVLITISDAHIRDAIKGKGLNANYALYVQNMRIGQTGDVTVVKKGRTSRGVVASKIYPFSVNYKQPVFFDASRLIKQGAGLLIFVLLISLLFACYFQKYLNKYTTPEENLRRAIDNGDIIPFYQPIVNGKTGAIYGVEVLARWKHPTVGFISPVSFIPIAERTGLIIPLTQSLMQKVIAQMNPIMGKLPKGFHIGINFSSVHINSQGFMADCLAFQQGFTGNAIKLVIEVTEREPLLINTQLIDNLNTLHRNGVAIALDDFGTGYSGLSYLNDLEIDYIKIDKSFVGRVNDQQDSTRLLDCVIDIARKLSLSIVAEGVETREQVDYLNRNNITLLQGYYFSKPVSYIELIKILLAKPKEDIQVS